MATSRKPAPKAKAAAKPATGKKPAATKQAQGGGKASHGTHYPDEAGSIPAPATTITPKMELFAREYLVDFNAAGAYSRTHPGVKQTTAEVEGHRLLRHPKVAAAIRVERDRLTAVVGLTAERALAEAWAIATADARELVGYHVGCCRHCFGIGFGYQRTKAEATKAVEEYKVALAEGRGNKVTAPDLSGGDGFDPRKDANPECPNCLGNGHGRTVVRDTRFLSPAARALYAGVKETKDGFEVKMHSKVDALEKCFKHLGLYEKDNRQKVDALGDLLAGIGRSALPVVKDPAP